MFKLLSKSKLRFKNHSKKLYHKCYTTHSALQTEAPASEKIKDDIFQTVEEMSRLKLRTRIKKPQRAPFVKELFIGNFDTEMLAYPQLEKDELEELNTVENPIKDAFFTSTEINKADYFDLIKKMQVCGLKVPQLLGGRELTVTEECKLNESIHSDSSIALSVINNENFVIQTLLKFGTDDQKKKYLPQLSSGELVGTFCMNEKQSVDPLQLKSRATLSKDKKYWLLDGEKTLVINGVDANLFVVFANTEVLGRNGLKESKVSAFLVERGFGGVSHTPCRPLGLHKSDIANVTFKNTPVPVENVLGQINHGNNVVEKLLTELRLSLGTACIPLTKKILNGLIQHNLESNLKLSETDFCISKVGKISTWLYVMESMTYLTSLLSDQYENQDCEIEAAIVKYFASKFAHQAALETMSYIGFETYMTDHWINSIHNDALAYQFLHEINDNLKIVIALMGLRHAGIKLAELINKVRNPFYNSALVIKRNWKLHRHIQDNPKLTLHLSDHLHPSLRICAEWLEYCVLRLQFATETLLELHGPKIVTQHMELERLGECAVYIYAMAACLGRSSRSYCIGLRNADMEIFITTAFCFDARNIVQDHVQQIYKGRFSTRDEFHAKISQRMFDAKKYCSEHPLARNF